MAVRTRRLQVPHPGASGPGSSPWLALTVLCISILMVNLDNTVLNVAPLHRRASCFPSISAGGGSFGGGGPPGAGPMTPVPDRPPWQRQS